MKKMGEKNKYCTSVKQLKERILVICYTNSQISLTRKVLTSLLLYIQIPRIQGRRILLLELEGYPHVKFR